MPDNPIEDLWREMESAAAAPDEIARVTFPRTPVQRRPSLKEKLTAATLDGYVPAFLAVAAGSLAATSQRAVLMPASGIFGVGLYVALVLLMVPLVLVMRGLWAAPKASPARYLLLVVLATGLSYEVSALTLAGFASQYLDPLNLRQFVTLIQDLYEAFLTPLPIVASALLGLVLQMAMQRMRRGTPWVELRPAAAGMLVAGWLVLLSPWLALAACALTNGHIAPQAREEYQRFSRHYDRDAQAEPEPAWNDLLHELAPDGYLTRQTIRAWTPTTIRKGEARVLELLRATPNSHRQWNNEYTIGTALLTRAEHLVDATELSWRLLERASLDRVSRVHPDGVAVIFHLGLYPKLAEMPLSQTELSQELARLERLEKALPTVKDELEATFLRYCEGAFASSNGKVGPRPLRAFGMELPFSPERTLTQYRTRLVITQWREILGQLDFRSQNALQRSLNQALVGRSSFSTYRSSRDVLVEAAEQAVLSHSGLTLRSHLDGARTLLSLRLYKAQHGSYPRSLEPLLLPPSQDRHAYHYESDGKQASLTFPFCRNRYEVGPEATWKLR